MASRYLLVSMLLFLLSRAGRAGEFNSDMENAESCACNIPRSAVVSNEGGDSPPRPPSPSPTGVPNSSSQRRSLAVDDAFHESAGADRDMVVIPGRVFDMGTDSPGMPYDGESPRRKVRVSSFLIDKYEVSNAQYEEFVRDTGHITDSEKWNWSFVLFSSLSRVKQKQVTMWVQDAPWWTQIEGSYWRAPEGPGSDVFSSESANGDRRQHPAVHISWTDAKAFCEWRGGSRLPTEAEWELAARGPSDRKVFPWGNVLAPNGTRRLNIYEGDFPKRNSMEDGYAYTAPVDAYGPQNEYGVYNMVGNVWEWVDDWWATDHEVSMGEEGSEAVQENPRGPDKGIEKVKKGGSFLCHKKFCYRYRNAARFKVEVDNGTQNSGFRCAKDIVSE